MTFQQYLTDCLTKPFKWGEHDCTLFVTNWLNISSGKDILEDVPKWNSKRDALRMMSKYGGLENACNELLEKIPLAQAKDGDVGMVGDSLCLFVGSRIVATGVDGLIYFDRGTAKCAWRYY